MLPAVAAEALDVANDPDCTTAELASVIERDVRIATDMLSVANSVMFAAQHPAVDLRQAVARLGFKRCRNLILTASAASLMKKLPLEQEWMREVLSKHSFRTALTCSHLNHHLKLNFTGEEFAAGLLHDAGRLLMAIAAPELISEADPLNFEETASVLDRERDVMGVDHCAFGSWFLLDGGLPESLASAVRYHHEPHLEQPHQKLTALVAAADHMANHLQVHNESDNYDSMSNTGLKVLAELCGPAVQESFDHTAVRIMDDVLASDESEGETTR